MSERRRSARYSAQSQNEEETCKDILNIGMGKIERKLERIMSESIKSLIQDTVDSLKNGEFAKEAANYKTQEHIEEANNYLCKEMDKLGLWVDDHILEPSLLQNIEDKAKRAKEKKQQKTKKIKELAETLAKHIAGTVVQQAKEQVKIDLQNYVIKLQNLPVYDSTLKSWQKKQKEIERNSQRITRRAERVCKKYRDLANKYG